MSTPLVTYGERALLLLQAKKAMQAGEQAPLSTTASGLRVRLSFIPQEGGSGVSLEAWVQKDPRFTADEHARAGVELIHGPCRVEMLADGFIFQGES